MKPLAAGATVWMWFPFRPLPEHELWVADVASLSRDREDAIDPDDNLYGSPELVVEVLSPSNTASEMLDRKQMCLSTGSVEFWAVDPKRRIVEVSSHTGRARFFAPGENIESELFPGAFIAVDSIFE